MYLGHFAYTAGLNSCLISSCGSKAAVAELSGRGSGGSSSFCRALPPTLTPLLLLLTAIDDAMPCLKNGGGLAAGVKGA